MSKILVVEDEPMLLDMICSYLKENNYEVIGVKEYDKALNLAYENSFDLWIFDVKIIGGSGFDLLKELRQSGRGTPCIFVTSLNTINDLKDGFTSGCDDYIKKPFELKELLLRVNNILKRTFVHNIDEFENINSKLKFDVRHGILYKNGEILPLANKQSRLLLMLIKNRDKFITRDEIFNEIWEYDEEPSELSLRVYISELRKIIGKDRIISQSKLGYKYV
ncbi:two-component system response regulator [Campylobacter blaseri]|uniref:Two-component system response regulator n=1 Tax=Campylobacter blaseri TaxID=2042961 RepID=A0A2P8R3G6_9BACT|nr:response regulator transcription factor [Campylobacter blaseri]PSM53034.1 two-component system response regulator [Campylobacter blaseri]PSM54501.1 two-component system response regulator [Campylobacter blaseri]QKF85251.1 two-component system response regulator [Campylobacter blaseri]